MRSPPHGNEASLIGTCPTSLVKQPAHEEAVHHRYVEVSETECHPLPSDCELTEAWDVSLALLPSQVSEACLSSSAGVWVHSWSLSQHLIPPVLGLLTAWLTAKPGAWGGGRSTCPTWFWVFAVILAS